MHLNPSQPLLALHWQPPVEQMVVCAGVHGFGGPGGPGGALQGVQVKLNTSQWWQFGRSLQIVQKLDGWAALVVAARRRRVVVCNSINSMLVFSLVSCGAAVVCLSLCWILYWTSSTL